jgi:hypothetical protein
MKLSGREKVELSSFSRRKSSCESTPVEARASIKPVVTVVEIIGRARIAIKPQIYFALTRK